MKDIQPARHAKKRNALGRSLYITAVYALAGYIWIFASEYVMASALSESRRLFEISILKGLGFVTVTAILLFLLVFTNIRKIIRESESREKSETALKEAQQLAHVGSFSYDAKTKLFECSDEARHILGLEENRFPFAFDTILSHIKSGDRERVGSLVQKAVLAAEDASFSCSVVQSDGSDRTVYTKLQSIPLSDSTYPHVVGAIQDVTDRMQAEAAARENEAIYKALINSSYDLVYLKDSSLRYISVNTNMQRYYGCSEDELIGKTIDAIKPGPESRLWEARDRSVLNSGSPLYIEDSSDGRVFETIIFPVDMTGDKHGVGGISRDITQRKQIEAAVALERDRAQTYFDIASIIIVAFDMDAHVTLINQTGCEKLGLEKSEIIGKAWIEHFVPEDDRKELYDLIDQIYDGTIQKTAVHENRIINAQGEIRIFEWRNTILRDARGQATGLLAAGVDITDLRHAMQALSESERSKSVLLSNLPGMAYRCAYDQNWTMQFVSSGCFELTGYLPEELIDNACISFNDIICPEYREPIWEESFDNLAKRESNRYEYEILTASGERKWVLDINQGVWDESETLIALEGIIIDITQSKLQFLQIQYLSNHDQLTGLHNRQYYDNAKKKLDHDAYYPLSVFLLDINGLKLINDAFGYDTGDRMIQTTASVLKANILPKEILARLGGDEFGILMPNTDALACAERMQTLKNAFTAHNSVVKDRAMVITLSIGCGTKTGRETEIDQVEKDAEANMARKKLFDQKSHHNAVLTSIMATLFERSFETEEHAERIGKLCAIVGARMGLSHSDIDKLQLFAILHDIGKIGISDQILNKPSGLDEAELAIMRTHPEIGYRIAMASPDFASVAELILTHHERWDGTGYPNHLSGEKIPLLSRILAVADAYDAMTKDRVYRKALSREVAMEEIRRNAGTQFDPQIAQVFLDVLPETDI
ncbi:MAG: PAS domain S-box protein [Clostridiales bacterium]|nr:PAS domain S-box protein [Clostridiales bacterium]